MTDLTIKCPYCSEEILADAKKCKHCGEFLDTALKPQVKRKDNYIRKTLVIIVIVIVSLFILYALIAILNGHSKY